jgi:2'-5' RNA ligase
MQAIATLLKHTEHEATRQMWQTLRSSCDLTGIKVPENPHFSWMVAEEFDEAAARRVFQGMATKIKGLNINTNGLGLFTSKKPILYIPIVKTKELLDLHEELWRQLSPFGSHLENFYHPSEWIPHITLASEDLTISRLQCILESIAQVPINATFAVDNLALIYSDENSAGINFIQEF